MPRVTSIDVAQRAGVSQSTVSRVFSPAVNSVAPLTRERVLRAARELGYHPDAIARSLSSQRTNIIGLVMANLTSPFYPFVLEKFLQRLPSMNKQALVFSPAPDQDVDALLPLIMQHRVDALIVTSATLSSRMARQCAAWGLPVILFNRTIPDAPVSAVCTDNALGGRMAADLLLDSGHTRLAYLAGTANTSTSVDRGAGFAERLRERGLPPPLVAQGNYTYESGYTAARELLSVDQPPNAIFCANDIMALGALDCARYAFRRRVPYDLSILGFDDIPMAGWASYDLTTFCQPVDVMIDAALELLQALIADVGAPPQTHLIVPHLIARASVRGLARGE